MLVARKWVKRGTYALAVLVAVYSIVQYYLLSADSAGFVQMKLESMNLDSLWYGMLYAHIAGSAAAIVIGPINLSSAFHRRNLKMHRMLGRVYAVGIVVGGLAGIYLAFYATGGVVSTLGFLGLDLMWLFTVYFAVKTIREKRVDLHRRWMVLNYALTLAGVTLRLWLGLFVLAFGEENFDASYRIIAWLCWVPNLVMAQVYLRKTGSRLNNVPRDRAI